MGAGRQRGLGQVDFPAYRALNEMTGRTGGHLVSLRAPSGPGLGPPGEVGGVDAEVGCGAEKAEGEGDYGISGMKRELEGELGRRGA